MAKKIKNKRVLIIATVLIVALVVGIVFTTVHLVRRSQPETMTGTYYYMIGDKELTLTLTDDLRFVYHDGVDRVGSYTLSGDSLKLDFDKDSNGEAEGTIGEGFLSLTYLGESMRFIEKIEYTVRFESQGEEVLSSIKVINGMSLQPPKDPAREGYTFAGWYTDSTCTTPFVFNSQQVTSNMTLYAKWILGSVFE